MRTVVLGERPAKLQALLDRRRALGQDRFDEVWEGAYHVSPAPRLHHALLDEELAVVLRPLACTAGLVGSGPFNLGTSPNDYRVPDRGYHRNATDQTFVPTAAVVVENLSPDDETFTKFAFYATHHVDELLVADPVGRRLRVWQLVDGRYVETGRSALLGVTADDLTAQVSWPS